VFDDVGSDFVFYSPEVRLAMMDVKKKGKSLLATPRDYVVVDIETTGLKPKSYEVIEIAALKVVNHRVIDEFQTLVSSYEDIDEFIINLTGITNDMVKDAPGIEQVLPAFMEFLGDSIIVGHSVNFDIHFLSHNMLFHFQRHLSNDFVDTLRLSRRLFPNQPNHKLITLAKYFNLDTTGYHRALNDCYMTHGLYIHICEHIEREGIEL